MKLAEQYLNMDEALDGKLPKLGDLQKMDLRSLDVNFFKAEEILDNLKKGSDGYERAKDIKDLFGNLKATKEKKAPGENPKFFAQLKKTAKKSSERLIKKLYA